MTRLIVKREPAAEAGGSGGGRAQRRSEREGAGSSLAQPGSTIGAAAGGTWIAEAREAGSGCEDIDAMSPAARNNRTGGASRRRADLHADDSAAPRERAAAKVMGAMQNALVGECMAACGSAAAGSRGGRQHISWREGSARGSGMYNTNYERNDEQESRNNLKLRGGNALADGYNSADEYDEDGRCKDNEDLLLKEEKFERDLWKERGFVVRQCKQDGNCLFRAVSDQLYGDQEMHDEVRERCLNYISQERDHFGQFITEEFDQYVQRKRKDAVFGNNLEMHALAEMYNRPIEVYSYSTDAATVLHKDSKSPPIRLSYHRGCHYNSVVDPKEPQVGTGLGLPDQREQEDEVISCRIVRLEARELDEREAEEQLMRTAIEASLRGWETDDEELQMQFEQICIEQTLTLSGCEVTHGASDASSAGAALWAPETHK